MNTDVIAEIIATSFNADRPVLHRYSATVRLHAPDEYPTPKSVEYGASADEARVNAVRKALQSWGGVTIVPDEVHVSSRTLPNGYGLPYLDEADTCMAIASRMPAGSQAYTDMMAAADWYERQYLAVRYDYLRSR